MPVLQSWYPGTTLQVEVRRDDTGEVVYRDMMSCAVSSILKADYRGDGTPQVVVCGIEGEVGASGCPELVSPALQKGGGSNSSSPGILNQDL